MQAAAFPIALAAAAVMGFANQRGGTCMVAAIKEVVARRRYGRLLALLEASVWVGAGFILLNAAHGLRAVPPAYRPGWATLAGGVLTGLGAFLNDSCLFGTVARLGSGQWAYAATPVGLYFGAMAASGWRFSGAQAQLSSPLLAVSTVSTVLGVAAALAFVAWRLVAHGVEMRRTRRSVLAHLSTPHMSTTVIAIGFLAAFAAVGAWDYAEFVRGLGQGDVAGWVPKSLLAVALLAGAVLGGRMSGRFRLVRPDALRVLRCLAGGFLMGAGATLIPGGNTSLTLFGMPLLRPHAWLAFAVICATIYVAIRAAGLFGRRARAPGEGEPL